MARPRNIRFYDEPLPQTLPEEQQWLPAYHKHSRVLVNYITKNGAGSTAFHTAIKCLAELRIFLIEEDKRYSPEIAAQWFHGTGPYPKGYQSTLSRIADLFAYGEIQPVNIFPMALSHIKVLQEPWRSLLSGFLNTLECSEGYKEQVGNCAARFLYRIQAQGISQPSEITFNLLESYCQMDGHRSESADARYTYAIGDILLFMADNGLCRHGLGWYPYFRMHGQIFRICDFTKSQTLFLEKLKPESLDFSADEFAAIIPCFLEDFKALGYSDSPCSTARHTLYNLLLFLEMHGFGYHRSVADIWLEHEKTFHKGDGWKQTRRILRLFELYTKEGCLIPQTIFREKPLLCEPLPLWCRTELNKYMSLKEKEGWAQSTLDMIRSSVTRFCIYLAGLKLERFSNLSPETLKSFNLHDMHLTAEGKNAYNSRIRKFIKYLERKGIISYGLHGALYSTSAPTEKLVITLTEEEKGAIKDKHATSHSSLELRDKAMVLLGMKMGLRSSDIVTILLSDINWEKQTLHVIQEKTDHEILLPLPTDVGNAIYLYITEGRPNEMTISRYLFIKERVPYDRLHRGACAAALKRTLPERAVSGSGFHVTRKTYATDCLCRGTGKQGIADLLGQQGTHSVNHYLRLGGDRMRMCPIPLTEVELLMEGGRYGNL